MANFIDPVLEVVRERFGKILYADEIRTWAFFEELGLNQDQLDELYEEIACPGFCSSLPPAAGAIDGLSRLRELVDDIYAVTTPWPSATSWAREREEWLSHHFGITKVVHTVDKHIIAGDIFVDDHAGNVARWQAEHPSGQGMIWTASYNRHASGYRVSGWADLCNYIKWRKKQ